MWNGCNVKIFPLINTTMGFAYFHSLARETNNYKDIESYTCTHMWMKAWYLGGRIPIPILSKVLWILFWSFRKWLEPSFLPFAENKYSSIEFRTLTSTATTLDDSVHCVWGSILLKRELILYTKSQELGGGDLCPCLSYYPDKLSIVLKP